MGLNEKHLVMSKIYYQIAEQYVTIEHPEAEDVRKALAKYSPFECSQSVAEDDVLLQVIADSTVAPSSDDVELEKVKDTLFESAVSRRTDGQYHLLITYNGHIVEGIVSDDWRRLKIKADWTNLRYAYLIDRLIMICYTMATLPLGYIKVHASVTELHGQALVLMGVSGTGKSTHSRLWREYVEGATLLNDDEPIVKRVGDRVLVYGCPWSGSTPCYRNESAEVAAFVHLYQAPENKLTRLSGRQSFDSLFTSCAFMLSLPRNQFMVFDAVAQVLEIAPVYRLDNRPEKAAVDLSRTLIPT